MTPKARSRHGHLLLHYGVVRNPSVTSGISDESRHQAARRGQWLEVLTIVWNSLEALLSISAGLLAGSIALVGFGFDSLVEIMAGVALLWRLRHEGSARREETEKTALKWVGASFVLLALYVLCDALHALIKREVPQESYIGIAIALLSLLVMPALARAKRNVAAQLQSRAMQADSKQTDLCAYLSAILLGGLVFNALFGWWWADPLAALIMVPIIFKEGINALRGHSCGCDSCGS